MVQRYLTYDAWQERITDIVTKTQYCEHNFLENKL